MTEETTRASEKNVLFDTFGRTHRHQPSISFAVKAAQYTSSGRVEIVDTEMPAERSDRILVRMTHAAVCGSDLHVLHDSPDKRFPLAPGYSGHECVGTIISAPTPEDVDTPVLLIPPKDNGFSEYLSVDKRHAIPLPENLTPEEGLMAQQLGTVLHCLKKLDNVIGKSVAVVGQGPAGLLFTTLLAQMGAHRVIGLDVIDHRLETARRMGATHAANPDREDPFEAVRHATQGTMADVVIEAVGKPETMNLCADLVRSKGTVVFFGVPKRSAIHFEADRFFRKQNHVVFSVNTQSEPDHWPFRLALDLASRRRVDLSALISHRLPFAHIGDAFHLAHTKDDGAVKVLLEFAEGEQLTG